jgi:hypothetical protein
VTVSGVILYSLSIEYRTPWLGPERYSSPFLKGCNHGIDRGAVGFGVFIAIGKTRLHFLQNFLTLLCASGLLDLEPSAHGCVEGIAIRLNLHRHGISQEFVQDGLHAVFKTCNFSSSPTRYDLIVRIDIWLDMLVSLSVASQHFAQNAIRSFGSVHKGRVGQRVQ